MKKIKALFFTAVSLFLVVTLCGCSVNITISKKDKDNSESDKKTGNDVIEFLHKEPMTNLSGMVVAPNAKAVRVSKALKEYQKAVDKIKTDSIGFTKIQWQDFNNINISERTGIADMVLTIVSKNVIKNNTRTDAEQNAEVFRNTDTAAIRANFPLFGLDAAYIPSENDDYISGAECEKKEDYKEYYIYFADAFNPVMGEAGFGGVMTPFDRQIVLDGIRNYGWNVKQDTMKFDCTFRGCYLMFRVSNDGNLIYLEQNMYADIDAKAEVDLIVAETNFLNGQCRYEEHYIYKNFTY